MKYSCPDKELNFVTKYERELRSITGTILFSIKFILCITPGQYLPIMMGIL